MSDQYIKIVGVPEAPIPKGTSGKVFSQTLNSLQGKVVLTVFANTFDYANSITGVEGEYTYKVTPGNPNPKGGFYAPSFVLMDPSARPARRPAPQGNTPTASGGFTDKDREMLKFIYSEAVDNMNARQDAEAEAMKIRFEKTN